jgi:integrase/recombinase XerD
MTENARLGPWLRRFLLEHLTNERNLAHNTQRSYRDTLCLLLPFIARRSRKSIDRLVVADLSVKRIQLFLSELVEAQRGCGIATRNQRLAAIRSLAGFIALNSPEHIQWCGEIRAIPFKKGSRSLVTYLEKDEMDALLAAPDETKTQGRRDHALLLYLYNTGARADEVAQGRITDLQLGLTPRDASLVLIRGKGNKQRRCPLWTRTVNELQPLVSDRSPSEHIFLNRRGQPLTRFGIHALVERYAAMLAVAKPSMARKRVSPHTIRHTTATHLLRAGVDINTIRAWLGHVSLQTTNVYAEVDLEMKAKALANCEVKEEKEVKPWLKDPGLMEFLRTL